ncbi:alpha/beta hydrolase [Sphingobium algorifonticola]|uniref:alpha/beta hydrolase n=1 Tax=Sphingobium algorifonticola TaxID=2008318 RepID=UPI0013E3445E|nr:alpha/beta hydrolase [Sphingobium algorifonticola]
MPETTDDEIAPGLHAALSAIPDFDALDATTLGSFRAALRGGPVDLNGDKDVSVELTVALGRDGHRVPCILHRPRAVTASAPVILNIHGGGYVVGDAAREAPAMSALATATGCAILSVDYRLAPDTPFPGALDDCTAALHWLIDEADKLRIDRNRIAIRGVSAGGGLAAGLMLRCLPTLDVSPCLLMLIYPMLDHRASPPDRMGQHVWTRRANQFGWQSYLGSNLEHAPSPEASPALAEDLTGFPPTFLAVGDIDLFLDENLSFASRLARSQVGLEMHVYRGGYHGFNLVPDAPISEAFARDCMAAIVRAFGQAAPSPSSQE